MSDDDGSVGVDLPDGISLLQLAITLPTALTAPVALSIDTS